MSATGQSAMRDLRRAVFDRIQALPLSFFDRYPVGRLVTRATNDIENVAEMFSAGVVALITDLLTMVVLAVVLVLGLINMMRGGSPNTSQRLMRLRVLLQFVAIIVIMATIWIMGR